MRALELRGLGLRGLGFRGFGVRGSGYNCTQEPGGIVSAFAPALD